MGIDLELEYEPLKHPWERDIAIVQAMVDEGFRSKELAAINQVRKCMEAFFLLDIANAEGTQLGLRYYYDWMASDESRLGKHWSRLTFGKEFPMDKDWQVWRKVLGRLTVGGLRRLLQPLRRWAAESTRIWRYYFDHKSACIECHLDD